MDDPARTAAYHECIKRRRNDLGDTLTRILTDRPNRSLVLEVGCGHGHFLTAYAQAHPDRLCIGIDLVGERIDRANRKRDRVKLANLHFIQAEARLFLEVLPRDVTIQTGFILFPDPWPKLRHRKHRIMQPEFLRQLAKWAGQGTRLYFRTDYQPYYDDTRLVFESHPDWSIVDEAWPFEWETVFQRRAKDYASLIARLRDPNR